MFRNYLIARIDAYLKQKERLDETVRKAKHAYDVASEAIGGDYQSAVDAFDNAIAICEEAIELFLTTLSYYNNYIWTRADAESETALVNKVKPNILYTGLFADRDLNELHCQTGKRDIYMAGVNLYKWLAMACLYHRDIEIASQADVSVADDASVMISWLAKSDTAFTNAIQYLKALQLPFAGRFDRRPSIEGIIASIDKRDLLRMLDSLKPEDKKQLFALVLNNPDSIFNQRFWKQEGLFKCNVNSGTLADIKKAYDGLVQGVVELSESEVGPEPEVAMSLRPGVASSSMDS